MDRRAATGLLLAFGAYASWGLLSPVGKHLLDSYEPLGLNAVRFALATVCLLPWLGVGGFKESLKTLARREVLWFNLLASVSLTLFLFSLVKLEPTFATLGFYSAPLWTAGLAAVVLKENVGKWFAPAAVGLLGGGYLALFGWATPGPGASVLGLALTLGSAVVWAFYAVDLRRHAPGIALKPLVGASYLFGTFYFYGLAVLLEGWPAFVGHSASTWGWMALYVAIPTLASFVLFNAAMQRAPASQVNILIAAELGFTVLFSWLLFDDRFSGIQLAGLGLSLASVSAYLWMQDRATRVRA